MFISLCLDFHEVYYLSHFALEVCERKIQQNVVDYMYLAGIVKLQTIFASVRTKNLLKYLMALSNEKRKCGDKYSAKVRHLIFLYTCHVPTNKVEQIFQK